MNREEALSEIVALAKRNQLTADEVLSALTSSDALEVNNANQTLKKLFGFIGGILMFAGIILFIAMKWSEINSISRILLTLGIGFCAFIMAITCSRLIQFEKASTPLFIIAALLQPTGVIIFLKEYSTVEDPVKGILFTSLVFLIQQGFIFFYTRRTELLLTTILFGLAFFWASFQLMDVPYKPKILILSISLLCITWVINQSRYQAIAAILFFLGSLSFLGITFDILRNEPYEILYLGISCAMIYAAIVARSRTLLINATLATLAYIGYYTGRYFPHTLGWPITLIILGIILILMSSFVIKLNNKYIKKPKA